MSLLPRPVSARVFTLVDAMILVASVAVGFAMVRGWVELRSRLPQLDSGPLPPRLLDIRDGFTAARMVLLSVTLAVIPLGLRTPKPPQGGRWGRPGMVVPIAVALATLACLLDEGVFPFVIGFYYLYASPEQRLFQVATGAVSISRAATAVGLAWLALALAGRWEPEISWVGRFGRALGFIWIGGCLGYRAYELALYALFRQVVN
jgi:hypothetical protein